MKTMAVAAFLMALSLPAARAEPALNGFALLTLCEGSTAQKAACDAYLRGVSDTLDFIAGAVPESGLKPGCVPHGTPSAQLRSVMVKMLQRKEIHKNAPAASLAMTGFSAAWRCNPNGKYHDAEEALGKAIR
jgi:hypothetical protein